MPTQYGEDKKILEHFAGRTGRFLDIGAADGVSFSNTLPLLEAGWTGVYVEPALINLRWLLERFGADPRVEILPFAIGPDKGTREFWEPNLAGHAMYSSASPKHVETIKRHSGGEVEFRRRAMVPMLRIVDLIEAYPGPYEFINIDVEGWNLEVLSSITGQMCRNNGLEVEMICVEVDPEAELQVFQNELKVFAQFPNIERIGGNLLGWK